MVASLALLILSPFIGEIITGNMPLRTFLTPSPIPVMVLVLYGGGAILIRETAIRWHKGSTTTVLLGLAYGAIEEGLVTKGFFNPDFYAVIGFGMQNFGRVAGINVLWALSIMLFHAIFSIAIPIALVDALFGAERRLSTNVYLALLVVFAANAFAFNLFLASHGNSYVPDTAAWWIVWGLLGLLVLAARVLPEAVGERQKPPNPLLLLVGGFVVSAFYFVLSQGFQHFVHNALVNFIVLSAFALVCGWRLRHLSPSVRGTVVMAAGFMAPMIVTGIVRGAYATMIPMAALLVFAWFKSTAEPV